METAQISRIRQDLSVVLGVLTRCSTPFTCLRQLVQQFVELDTTPDGVITQQDEALLVDPQNLRKMSDLPAEKMRTFAGLVINGTTVPFEQV